MNKIIGEIYKSVRYIIPIFLLFIGIIILQNYNTLFNFIKLNLETLSSIATHFIIGFIITYILNSKYALFLGVVIDITNMIPFFGPIIGAIVATIINLFFSFDKAIIVLVALIIAQQIESSILEPYFVGRQVGVPPILAVTLAGQYT